MMSLLDSGSLVSLLLTASHIADHHPQFKCFGAALALVVNKSINKILGLEKRELKRLKLFP